MYLKILASALIILVAMRVIGGILGKRKLVKAAVVGLVLIVTVAILNWILLGLSPVPSWFLRLAKDYWPL